LPCALLLCCLRCKLSRNTYNNDTLYKRPSRRQSPAPRVWQCALQLAAAKRQHRQTWRRQVSQPVRQPHSVYCCTVVMAVAACEGGDAGELGDQTWEHCKVETCSSSSNRSSSRIGGL
jgi:hypothetical protein